MNREHLTVALTLRRFQFYLLVTAAAFIAAPITAALANQANAFVRISPRDPRYFELSDGSCYIPIGLNMIHPSSDADEEQGLAQMQQWLTKLSENQGNFIRIWLSHEFWDVEHSKSGQYDPQKARRIDRLLSIAENHGIRVKLTLEHFRNFEDDEVFGKHIHHTSQGGPARNVTDFFTSRRSQEQFKSKLDWYASRYSYKPTIFGWELWNEINAVAGRGWTEWTELMLDELHSRFPNNLAMQSLGSLDIAEVLSTYRTICRMTGNDVAQVHRYLDLGAALKVCHGPVDVLAADAVSELRAFRLRKPILLAESGAVGAGHSGPFELYEKDQAGMILHDVLFAPFFAGAAGPGQIWHWDTYVDKNNLWHHYARFAEVVEDIDLPDEIFEPVQIKHSRMRVYALKGKNTILIWCRDISNDWRTELKQGVKPQIVHGVSVELSKISAGFDNAKIRTYNPWTDKWTDIQTTTTTVALPDFHRSIVVRIEKDQPDSEKQQGAQQIVR
jgi:hypothetical protein